MGCRSVTYEPSGDIDYVFMLFIDTSKGTGRPVRQGSHRNAFFSNLVAYYGAWW